MPPTDAILQFNSPGGNRFSSLPISFPNLSFRKGFFIIRRDFFFPAAATAVPSASPSGSIWIWRHQLNCPFPLLYIILLEGTRHTKWKNGESDQCRWDCLAPSFSSVGVIPCCWWVGLFSFRVPHIPPNCLLSSLDAQVSTIFGNALQADNCASWSPWGPCIWLRGDNPRWQRSYFDQLLPGRTGCRSHTFFKLLKERWGTAFSNVVAYLREMTLSTAQCGFCSYQQSCGRKCHRRGGATNSMNPLFVAERLCEGIDQSEACISRLTPEGKCTLWPNRAIPLPNVSDWMVSLLDSVQFLNCVPQTTQNGERICRCCCTPFVPVASANFRCEHIDSFANSSTSSSVVIAPPTHRATVEMEEVARSL